MTSSHSIDRPKTSPDYAVSRVEKTEQLCFHITNERSA